MTISNHVLEFSPLKLGNITFVDPAGLEFSGCKGRYSTTDSRFFRFRVKVCRCTFCCGPHAPMGPFYSRGFGVGFGVPKHLLNRGIWSTTWMSQEVIKWFVNGL